MSGGIDSSSCIYYYKKLGFNVHGLFVNYGQKAFIQEEKSVKSISKYFSIKTQTVETTIKPIIENSTILGRNYFLLSAAIMSLPFTKGIISLGIHSGTKFPDCTSVFIKTNQEIIDLYSNGNIIIDCPFIELHKQEIIKYFMIAGIPIKYTYSCEEGKVKPCRKCLTCIDLKQLYESENI